MPTAKIDREWRETSGLCGRGFEVYEVSSLHARRMRRKVTENECFSEVLITSLGSAGVAAAIEPVAVESVPEQAQEWTVKGAAQGVRRFGPRITMLSYVHSHTRPIHSSRTHGLH